MPTRTYEISVISNYLIKKLFLVVGPRRKGREADEQNVHDHTCGPYVDLDPIACLGQNFWGNIGRSATHREQRLAHHLRQAEIPQFEAFGDVRTA